VGGGHEFGGTKISASGFGGSFDTVLSGFLRSTIFT
jgi:hypothetical protein